MLIEAIRILKEKKMSVYSKLKILILGDGPLRRVVDRLIKKHGLDSSVQLIGKVSREKVINTLKESDIYCLPTIREPGGGSILEAMAAGLPIITSDYGGPKYSVTEDCGIKIKVSNYEQYVQDLVSAIIKLSSDEALRKKMGENARRRVEQEFSLDALEKKIIALYDEVLNEK